MEQFGNIYTQVGAVGFSLILVGVMVWRGSNLMELALRKKFNGKLAQPEARPVAACAWAPEKQREWSKIVDQVGEVHAIQIEQRRQVDQGTFSCQWTLANIADLTKSINDLTVESKLLRQEFELRRTNGGR